MANKRVLVLGGNFAGLTAALSVKHELDGDVEFVVVSKSDRFQFNPSLIWVPFGKRTRSDVTFPVGPTFEARGVEFVHAEATTIDVDRRRVETSRGAYDYDYLVIATGYLNDFDVVPGLGPGGNAHAITDLEGAVEAAVGWSRFLNDPGPVVVAATQGAACFGAAYEFVFNVAQLLGMFFRMQRIDGVFDVATHEVAPGELHLADGRTLPFKYAMVVPPFVGA